MHWTTPPHKNKKLIGLSALLAGSLLCAGWVLQLTWAAPLRWHMINVNYSIRQADAHLLRTGMGTAVMIDVGDEQSAVNAVLPYLREQGIDTLDHVFISHPHKDHYGGLESLLKNGIRIKAAYFNLPPKDVCDREIPWGCDYAHILDIRSKLEKAGAQLINVKPGLQLQLGFRSQLSVLYAFDSASSPAGPIDINDMSFIMRLQHGTQSALFTGDLNAVIGTHLARNGVNLKANILKIPHHGAEGVAPNEFFSQVAPEVSLAPSPWLLWCSERSARVRLWHKDHHIPIYVNGAHGTVVLTMHRDRYGIQAENTALPPDAQSICPTDPA